MAGLSGRPLLDTRADAALFTGRAEELAQLRWAVRRELNCLLLGPRGSGKTSLLRHLVWQEREAPFLGGTRDRPPPLFLDAAGASTAGELLALVAARLGMASGESTDDARSLLDRFAGVPSDGWPAFVVLDQPRAAMAHAVFGQLRDEVWRLPVSWVVAAADTDEAALLLPPADAFFDVVVRLAPLDVQALSEALRRRLDGQLPDAAVRQVVEAAGGNPRRALDLARMAVTSPQDTAEVTAAVAERWQRAARLGRPAAMLLAELEAAGAASASDTRLLDRLGWTRARASQVFGQLERAGLVQAAAVRNGPGRPRRVYRVVGGAAQ
jgi:hypothetical protein